MNHEHEPLRTKDGEPLDGFSPVDEPSEDLLGVPLRPQSRCKRCNCWLRAPREDSSRRASDNPQPPREYCSACTTHMRRHSIPCAMCGDIFFTDDRDAIRCEACEEFFQENKRTCPSCSAEFLPFTCKACGKRASIRNSCPTCHWLEAHAKKGAEEERECRVCGCRFIPRKCIVPECGANLTDVCTICHEAIEHEGMVATVWDIPDCQRCHRVIHALERRHRNVQRKNLRKLSSGEEPDIDAMAHLAMSGGQAPLVFLDGRFMEPEEIDALVAEEKANGSRPSLHPTGPGRPDGGSDCRPCAQA